MAETKKEMVNHPSHYNQGKYEVIEVLKDWGLDKDAYLWNACKYIARAGHKDDMLQDLKKAAFYLNYKIKILEEEGNK